jgi:PhnB protein
MTAVNPYLTFDGDCEEAFELYEAVFGGDLSEPSRFSMMPEHEPADANRVLHMSLLIDEGQAIMGSDRPSGVEGTFGSSMATTVAPDSEEDAQRIFDALAEGGKVTVPYEKQFWGDFYGQCTDRFGHNWMVTYHPEG